jgi:hypothetical protein
LLSLSVVGCDESGEPVSVEYKSWVLKTSYLWHYGEVVQLPDTVIVGQPFEVVVQTGLNGCDRRGPTQVIEHSATEFEIVPRDSFFTGSWPCPASVFSVDHKVSLQCSEAGMARVLVTTRGRTDAGSDTLLTVAYPVYADQE